MPSRSQAAKEVEDLLDQQTVRANQLIKDNVRKMYQELVKKGTTMNTTCESYAKAINSYAD